jgi:glycosyltransferase involved in cell wall biosynthesis
MVAFTNYLGDTRIRREAEALVQRGDDVDIVCPLTPALRGRRSVSGVRIHTVLRFDYGDDAGPLRYLRRYVAFLGRASLRLLRLHLTRPYDVIHVHTMPDFLVLSALGPKLLGAKVVLDVHDLMPELYASKFDVAESHWIIRGLRAVERWCVRFSDRAVAVHRPHLDALVEHGNPEEKFEILMNLPDPRMFKARAQPAPSPAFTLVYHGMVGSRHGLDAAVRAVALARPQVPGLRLRIIGDGDYFPEIERLVEELGVGASVRLDRGIVPIEDLLPTIAGASAGIVPILDDPFTRYMLPVKLLEYVAIGIPVIASATDTIRAYFDEQMLSLCAPGDPGDLAASIVRLYRDRAYREALPMRARLFSAEHNWDREKIKYYELIDSLQTTVRRTHGRTLLRFQTPEMESRKP